MTSSSKLLRNIDSSSVDQLERARLRCRLAKELEEAGDYEGARDAMSELWQRIGDHPRVDGLDQHTAAEVLLRAGSLSGWIGRLTARRR